MTNKFLYENMKSHEPTVGMGATEVMFSDRHAYTVIEVLTAKKVVVQQDTAIRLDYFCEDCHVHGKLTVEQAKTEGRPCPTCGKRVPPMFGDSQLYHFEPNPNGYKTTVSLRKDGRWRVVKGFTVYVLGSRSEHYDYSF